MKNNVVDVWSFIFEKLNYLSTFFILRKILFKKVISPSFVELWVFCNLLFSLIVLTLQSNNSLNSILVSVMLVYGVIRVFEIVIYQVNVLMFDQYRIEKQGKKYELQSYRRLMVLSIQNYIEVLFWFASFYYYFNQYFNNPDLLSTGIGSFYYSLVTMSTLGYGDISPIAPEGYLLVIAHTGISIFLTLMIIARFISLLPKPETLDNFEKK